MWVLGFYQTLVICIQTYQYKK